MPINASVTPIGVTLNRLNREMVCAPGGRLRLALAIRSLSRISGELAISVVLVPVRMQKAIGSSSLVNGTPVRAERRLDTGIISAARAWLGMMALKALVTPLTTMPRRDSRPPDMRITKLAALDSAPARSSPAPMIMMAWFAINALPEKPWNTWVAGISPVSPITTTTSSATMSARIHSSTSMIMVKATSPSTRIMSGVRVRPAAVLSMETSS
jgi:hypothetical protein